ncbi:MAG: SH3 domain-containing protein [Pseudomonadota bacterium]
MKRALFSAVAAATVGGFLLFSPPLGTEAQARDCAHGPDFYRVRNVASDDHLNVRARPTASSPRVGAIPFNGQRVRCIGPCAGNWCKVDWFGTVGWVNMRFLGE